jgi:transposase
MMGKQQDQPKLFYYSEAVNLEKRVRRENPLRAIQAGVDFSFVRSEVASCYGQNGNESVDPEVILKMMFLLFYDNVASERELMRIIPERLDYQWFLGYGLDDTVPDHSVLSKARRRWGPKVFERLFVRTVQQAVALGLVDGHKIHMDSSLVDANASKDSVMKGSPKLMGVLKRVYQEQERKLDEASAILAAEAPTVEPAGAGGASEGARDSAAETEEGQPQKGSRYERVNDGLMSTTDPDAPVVRKGRGEARPRYKSHRSVDDAHGVITAVKSTPGDVDEGRELVGLLEQHERHTQKKGGAVVADSKYGTTENFLACAHRGVRSHMADLSATQQDTGRRKDIYSESDFAYDPKTDTYRCPAGQTLKRRRHKIQRQAYEYTTGPKLCQACPKRAQCTRSPSGRSIKRHEDHEALQAARAESKSREARRDRRRRRYLMEGSFADAANNHHFKRARWRGLAKQQIQDLLIAAIQNVRILLQHTRRSTQGIHAGIKVGLGSLSSLVSSLYGLLTCRAWRFRPRRACFGHFGP